MSTQNFHSRKQEIIYWRTLASYSIFPLLLGVVIKPINSAFLLTFSFLCNLLLPPVESFPNHSNTSVKKKNKLLERCTSLTCSQVSPQAPNRRETLPLIPSHSDKPHPPVIGLSTRNTGAQRNSHLFATKDAPHVSSNGSEFTQSSRFCSLFHLMGRWKNNYLIWSSGHHYSFSGVTIFSVGGIFCE